MNQGLYLFFRQDTASLEDCYFVKQKLTKYYILTDIEIKFTCPTNKQLQYAVDVFNDIHLTRNER